MDNTSLLILVLVLLGGLGIGAATAWLVSRQARRQAEVDRSATLEAVQAVLAERSEAVLRSAVETAATVAGEKLDGHLATGSAELGLRSEAFDEKVRSVNEELRRVGELVNTLQTERAQQHGQLLEGLEQAARTHAALSDATQGLKQALASPKARGQWGERMADDVLRMAGLVEGINYRKQTAMPNGSIPDVTFLMPDDLLLNMDVKFPIDNYLRYLEAETDPDRQRFCDAFVRDVRSRVKEVTGRGYVDPELTVDFMVLFIPNESVYGFIHEHAHALAEEAMEARVILCSPFTLFAVVGVIRQAMDAFRLDRVSDEILQVLGGFRGEWDNFCDRLDKLGKNIGTVQNSYDELSGARRRQLERKLDRVDDLRRRGGLEVEPGAPVLHLHELETG